MNKKSLPRQSVPEWPASAHVGTTCEPNTLFYRGEKKKKDRLRSDPHKKGSDTHVGFLKSGNLKTSPHPDNMGGSSAKSPLFTGYRFYDVQNIGTPSDYFYHLGVDLLQVSVLGAWQNEDAASSMLLLRTVAERNALDSKIMNSLLCPSGVELEIYPHGARPGYQVLLKGINAPEVRACPKQTGKASFMFRFGSRWCVEHTLEEMEKWVRDFLLQVGFTPTAIRLSEIHLRCDVPTPFVNADIRKMAGTSMRNGSFQVYRDSESVHTITNLGGDKTIKYSIYNKRLEQSRGTFWPAVWIAHEIQNNTPVWRIEARWKRPALLKAGLNEISDLTIEAIEGLWYRFSDQYLHFATNSKQRKSRSAVTKKWQKIAKCGVKSDKKEFIFKVDVSSSHLMKQAAGAVKSAINKSNQDAVGSHLSRLVSDVVDDGFESSHWLNSISPEFIYKRLIEAIKRHPDINSIPIGKWKDWLLKEVSERLTERSSQSENDKGLGGAGHAS